MGLPGETLGWLGVAGSILFFGIFNIPLKMMKRPPHPIVWSLYMQFPIIFLFSLITLSYTKPYVWSSWGLLGAGLWIPGSILSVYAIKYLGLAVAQGGWAACIVIVSFLWGSLYFGENINSVGLTVLALFLLCLGLAGLSLSGSGYFPPIWQKILSRCGLAPTDVDNDAENVVPVNEEIDHLLGAKKEIIAPQTKSLADISKGVLCMVMIGLFCGSMMVPALLTPKYAQDSFDISFSLGVLVLSPVFFAAYFLIVREIPEWRFYETFPYACLSGFFWSIANCMLIFIFIFIFQIIYLLIK